MSNRILGILIIIGFIGLGYIYYNLSYLPKVKANKLLTIKEKEKQEKIQAVELVKLDKGLINKSNNEKIKELIKDEKNYKTFNLSNNIKAYFKEKNGKLDFYYNYNKVGTFELVFPEYLLVSYVYGNKEYIYIEIGDKKYYFNVKTGIIEDIKLNIDVLYVKEGGINELIFVTNKGSFNYNMFNKQFHYFTYFQDYIVYKKGYIGIVKANDYELLKKIGFKSYNKNLIIYYNPYTKEKKILFSTTLNYSKIYLINNKVFIETEGHELYELENI